MTPELIPGLLGVRRERITDAAGKLQNAGLIPYRRGHISLLSRAVESHSCDCYGVVKTELIRLLRVALLTKGNSA